MKKCSLCNSNKLKPIIDFGNQYVSNFVQKKDLQKVDKSELKLCFCNSCKLAQLSKVYNQKKMYSKYWYISGVNELMKKELRSVVEYATSFVKLNKGDSVLDIASNDGTLLENYPKNIEAIGIDPSDVAKKSKKYKKNIKLVNDFFNLNNFKKKKKFRIITNIAMFYDCNKPIKFLKDLKKILSHDGIAIIQISYTPMMIKCNEFGVISHEHICYYTYFTLEKVLEISGLKVLDCSLNESNGGSIRVLITHKDSIQKNYFNINQLLIGEQRIQQIKIYEKKEKINTKKFYNNFKNQIKNLKKNTMKWLEKKNFENKKVFAYGASTKGNVLLQYYGIKESNIKYVVDRSKIKYNLYTPGSEIKIISEKKARNLKPDYLFILPWFFQKSIIQRELKLLKNGSKIILPQPKLTEISLVNNKILRRFF